MFNLSDRDAKLILMLLIVCVIALPYVFYSKETRLDTETQKAKNIQLEERYNQLLAMNEKREFYIAETKRYDEERNLLIASFPADIRPENYTMFLLNMEYNSQVNAVDKMLEIEEDETLQRPGMKNIDGNSTIYIDTVGYGSNDIIPISEEGSEDNLQGIVNTSALTYFCYYDGLKYLLRYLDGYYVAGKDENIPERPPMIYKAIDMSFDPDTGVIEGSITMDQYAISGMDRELEPADIWPSLDENEIRGNVEDGIFGPINPESLLERKLVEQIEEKLEEQATGELPVMEEPEQNEQ